MTALIELTDVTKTYGTQRVLDRVSLQLGAGEITAIMGPSGSGKSTLLNLVAGLDRATAGSITVAGRQITGLSEAGLARYRRETIGLVFQFFHLLNNLTVLDNVLIAAQLGGLSRREGLIRARRLLEQLGIDSLADSFPARLSGGQRQRVAIARALVNRPALLLADEPTGALDTHSGEGVLDLFRDLNRDTSGGERRLTIVLVTHDGRLAGACAHRVVSLVDGAVAGDRPAEPPRAAARLEVAR